MTIHPGKRCWDGSSRAVLLRKLENALKDHQIDEGWVIFNDFKNLYGFPTESVVRMLITELCYSCDSCWLRKARDLVISILKENSSLLHPEILAKLALSFARAQVTVPASMTLRAMLERARMPTMNILSLVVFHMVKTEIGACLASNILVQICSCFLCLSAKRNDHAKAMKTDAMFFNIVLDACVIQICIERPADRRIDVTDRCPCWCTHNCYSYTDSRDEWSKERVKKFKDHIDRV